MPQFDREEITERRRCLERLENSRVVNQISIFIDSAETKETKNS